MGTKTKEVGGGAATGLADEFIKFLQGGLQTGEFKTGQPAGGAAYQQTAGLAGVLNDLLAGSQGVQGSNMNAMISKETENQAAALRARYGAGGGNSFGTGAQYAEGVLRSESAPKQIAAQGQLQMQALGPLLQMLMNLTQIGTPQRQIIAQPHPVVSAIGSTAQLISALGSLVPGGGGSSPQIPQPVFTPSTVPAQRGIGV